MKLSNWSVGSVDAACIEMKLLEHNSNGKSIVYISERTTTLYMNWNDSRSQRT